MAWTLGDEPDAEVIIASEILKQIIPTASKVAVLINPNDQNASLQMRSATLAADKLAVRLEPVMHFRSEADIEGAFEGAVRARAAAAVRMIDPLGTGLRAQVVSFPAKFRLPTIYGFREDVLAGGLVTNGPSLPDQYRQVATFVHKVLNGARPADLPVEPTKFELTLNLQTARKLGLTIPPTMVSLADEVIE